MLHPVEKDEQIARDFAIEKHKGQKYGLDQPYEVHLENVRNILDRFGWNKDSDYFSAGWLHDVLEDTIVTPEQLRSAFGERIFNLVESVTGRHGETRKERNADQYRKLTLFPDGIPLKLADRIANGSTSKIDRLDLYVMYEREYPEFRAALKPVTKIDVRSAAMWIELDDIFNFVSSTPSSSTPSSSTPSSSTPSSGIG